MEVNFSALSGENVATLQVLPSETVLDLKNRLHKSGGSAEICDLRLMLDFVPLDDTICLKDLTFDSHPQLQVLWVRKSAREMLFSSPEIAFELAKQYDFPDGLTDDIRSLFTDEDHKDLPCRSKIEVLIALHQKISKVDDELGLRGFKAGLTEVALDALRWATKDEFDNSGGVPRLVLKPSARHVSGLISSFPWLGLEAVSALCDPDDSHLHSAIDPNKVRAILVSEYAKRPRSTLEAMILELKSTTWTELIDRQRVDDILNDAVQATKLARKAACAKRLKKNISSSTTSPCGNQAARSPVVSPLSTPQEVLAVAERHPVCADLAFCARDVKKGDVRLVAQTDHGRSHTALRSAVLAAVQQKPEIILQNVSLAFACVVVEECPGSFNYLPEELRSDVCILYTALAHDEALQEEFTRTASKSELQRWRWHMDAKKKEKRNKH